MKITHYFPADDWIEHRVDGDHETCDCPCGPKIVQIVYHEWSEIVIVHQIVRPPDLPPESLCRRLINWIKSKFNQKET